MNKFIQSIKNLDIDSIRDLLQKRPEWISWSEEDGKNALHYLCGLSLLNDLQKQTSSLSILKFLLKKGMDINSVHRIKEKNGFFPATPLWYAYTRGRNETVFKWLLTNGADPHNCMFAIAWYDDTESATLFKKHGAPIKDTKGRDTPFLAAFGWRRFKMVEWFLENGADVNASDKDGNTALFFAVKRKYGPEIIQLLLRFGADIHHKNKEGISPESFASSHRQRKVLELLKNAKPTN